MGVEEKQGETAPSCLDAEDLAALKMRGGPGLLAKTLPSPVPPDGRGKLRGARIAAAAPPAPAPGPVSVQRKVPEDGVASSLAWSLRWRRISWTCRERGTPMC